MPCHLQAGLLTPGSILVTRLPISLRQWHVAKLVPGYSGGPVSELHGVPLCSVHEHLKISFINEKAAESQDDCRKHAPPNFASTTFFIAPPLTQRRKQRMVNWKESQSLMRKNVHLHRLVSREDITVLLKKEFWSGDLALATGDKKIPDR